MNEVAKPAEPDPMIDHLRERERQLEIDARSTQARLEEVRDMLAKLDAAKKRGGRRRSEARAPEPTLGLADQGSGDEAV